MPPDIVPTPQTPQVTPTPGVRPTPQGTIDEMFKSAGVPLADTPEEVQVKHQKSAERIQGIVDREAQVKVAAKQKAASAEYTYENSEDLPQRAIKGGFVAVGDILNNVRNGVLGLADAAENYAASKGIGTGDILSEQDKTQNPLAYHNGEKVELGTAGDISRVVVNFTAPMLATVATGGGFAAGMAANAVYNYAAIDPEEQRLSDHLKGTFLEDIPGVASIIDNLQSKPTDTEMDSRIKNMFEGFALDVAVAVPMMAWQASKAYAGITKLKNSKVLDDAEKAVTEAEKSMGDTAAAADAPTGNAADTAAASPVTPNEQAALNASDEAISSAKPEEPSVKPTPEEVQAKAQAENDADYQKYVQENPTLNSGTNSDGIGANGADSDAFIEQMANAVRSNPEAFQRGETPLASTAAAASTWTEEEVRALLTWRPGSSNYVPNSEGLALMGRISDFAAGRVVEKLKTLNIDDMVGDELLAYTREMENLQQLSLQTDAISSEAGRTLKQTQGFGMSTVEDAIQEGLPASRNVTEAGAPKPSPRKDDLRPAKVLATITGLSDEEAVKVIGKAGREAMVKAVYSKYGGKEGMKDYVTKMNILAAQKAVAQYPDQAFVKSVSDIKEYRKAGYTENDALTAVGINGMLSSPTTWLKALGSNTIMSSKTMVENYVQAVTPGMDKTLAEANAHFMGALGGLYEGLAPAYKAFKTGRSAGATKFDLQHPVESLNVEDVAEKSGYSWAAVFGILNNNKGANLNQTAKLAVEAATARQLPRRIMVGIDTYSQHITTRGVVHAEAARAGIQSKLNGDALANFTASFVENPTPAVLQRAKYVAETNTFAKELEGGYALMQSGIEWVGGKIPPVKVILPFTKTGFNVMEESIKSSPLAPILDSQVRADIWAGGRVRDDAIAKIMTGTIPTVGLMGLAYQGFIKGEDRTAKDYKSSRAFDGSAPKGAAVKIPGTGKWVELPRGLTPLTTMINTATLLSKASGHLSDEEYTNSVNVYRAAIATQMESGGIAEGVSALMTLMDPSEDVNMSKVASDLVLSYVPMSGAMRFARNLTDGTKRDMRAEQSDGVMENFHRTLQARLRNIIPGMSDELPPLQNVWGADVELPDGLSPNAYSPISVAAEGDLELKRTFEGLEHFYSLNRDKIPNIARVPIEMPERQITNTMARKIDYELTPVEYAKFVKLSAGIDPNTGDRVGGNSTLKEAIYDVMTKYDALGKRPEEMELNDYRYLTGELNRTFMAYRQRARNMILDPQYGDVAAKMQEQAIKYQTAGTEVANGGQ